MSATAGLRAQRIASSVALTLFLSLLVAPAALAVPDFDGDGAIANDCAPLDRAVHPGAADKPDLAIEDTNCDGIDGDKAKAIFVSPGGNNGGTGSLTNPKATLNGATGAIATAKAAGKDVYIAGGTYNESAQLEDNVSLFGGYEPITGERTGALTTIKGAPAVLANGDTGVVLQTLTLEGVQDFEGNSYGLRALKDGANPSRLALSNVITSGAAAAPGGNAANGFNGGFAVGFLGGAGGAGGCGAGAGGAAGEAGFNDGAPGGDGSNGANNALALPDSATWLRPTAGPGTGGGLGGSGTGGTGGFGNSAIFGIPVCGGVGGFGGLGGGGAGGGSGGRNGGGSFGAYLLDSSIVATASQLKGGPGGAGGNGGNRGIGGGGGGGFGGGPGTCIFGICGSQGFTGASGAAGGNGGSGGGGVGGPSAGVYQAGAGSGYAAKSGTSQTAAPVAAPGGARGNGGPVAPAGQKAGTLRSGTAPATSTADFDGDGINDSADACPDQARGTGGSASGCPARPAKLPDPDGDGVPNDGRDLCPNDRATTDANSDGCTDPTGGGGGGGGGGVLGSGSSGPAAPTTIPSTVAINSLAFPKYTKLTNLSVKNLVAGTSVTVTCKTKKKKAQKKGCAYKSKRFATSGARAKLNLVKPFRKKKIPVGTTIRITIAAPGFIGKQVTYKMRARKLPSSRTLCIPPGGRPGACV